MPSPLRVFVPLAIRALVDRLTETIEAAAGAPIEPMVDLNPAIPRRIAAGEPFDLALTNPVYGETLFAAGHADRASHRAFGRIPLAVGRRKGVGGPVATEPDELAALLKKAASIGYTEAGTSGQTYLAALARLGLDKAVLARSRGMGAGKPVAAVAAGEVALAIAPLTVVLSARGVEPAAIFPDSAGAHIDISVFLAAAPRPGAAEALDFLTDRDLDPDLAAAGVKRFDLD